MSKLTPPIALKVKPIPKAHVRAQCAGEFVANLGGSEADVRIAQDGCTEQVFKEIAVYGVDRQGRAHSAATYNITDRVGDGDIIAVEDNDHRSMLERTDGAYAILIRETVADFQNKQLRPIVHYTYRDDIARDPDRRSRYNQMLGLSDTEPLYAPEGYELAPQTRTTPGRDRGQSIMIVRSRRRR